MKTQSNTEWIISLRQENPDFTLLQIGERVGVTRERVRQILKKHGLQTQSTAAAKNLIPKHLRKGEPCLRCGIPVPWVDNLAVQNTLMAGITKEVDIKDIAVMNAVELL